MLVNTPYDDVFRTLLNDCSSLIIPVVNEIFHESYSGDEAVEFYPNEHFVNGQDGRERERITDSCFGIRDRLEGLAESGKLTEYVKRTLEEMSGKVLEHIARGHEKVREGVKSIMGGRVLEYEAKTILREGIALGEARGLAKGLNEGRIAGLNEGRSDGIASTARRMLGMSFTSEQISQATGLSPDEVEALRRDQL